MGVKQLSVNYGINFYETKHFCSSQKGKQLYIRWSAVLCHQIISKALISLLITFYLLVYKRDNYHCRSNFSFCWTQEYNIWKTSICVLFLDTLLLGTESFQIPHSEFSFALDIFITEKLRWWFMISAYVSTLLSCHKMNSKLMKTRSFQCTYPLLP